MPANSWADKPRQEYLTSRINGYELAKERKRTRQFLALLHDDYFARFPEADEDKLFKEKNVCELDNALRRLYLHYAF